MTDKLLTTLTIYSNWHPLRKLYGWIKSSFGGQPESDLERTVRISAEPEADRIWKKLTPKEKQEVAAFFNEMTKAIEAAQLAGDYGLPPEKFAKKYLDGA